MRQSDSGRLQSPRPRIVYVTPRISDENGVAIWRGLVEAAQRFGVNLLCFAGGVVRHQEHVARDAGGDAVHDHRRAALLTRRKPVN
jgi:hypothetical protein